MCRQCVTFIEELRRSHFSETNELLFGLIKMMKSGKFGRTKKLHQSFKNTLLHAKSKIF